jgi:hypothetical protein
LAFSTATQMRSSKHANGNGSVESHASGAIVATLSDKCCFVTRTPPSARALPLPYPNAGELETWRQPPPT